jgi:O-antigen/teichoic acid export membrane protein
MLALVISLGAAYFYNYLKIKASGVLRAPEGLESSTERARGIFQQKNIRTLWSMRDEVKSIFSKSFPPAFARALVELKRWRAGLTVFLAALLVALVSNIDVILVKHFFEPGLAGEYAALSAIGKILIYVSSAFVTVMFAVVSESYASGPEYNRGTVKSPHTLKTFKNTLAYISVISLPAVLVFGFAPNMVVRIFFGATYIKIAPYLPIFSVAMFLLSLSIAFIYYFLATWNNSFLLPFVAGVLLQIVLISLNHSSIQNIVMSVLWSSIFLLIALAATHFLNGKFQTADLDGPKNY